MTVLKYFCTFPQHLIKEPIISHQLSAEFDVVPNIRAASITEQVALVAVEIEGETEAIESAVEYMRGLGVQVEAIRDDGA